MIVMLTVVGFVLYVRGLVRRELVSFVAGAVLLVPAVLSEFQS